MFFFVGLNCTSEVEFEECTKEQFDKYTLVEFENQETSCEHFRLDVIDGAIACSECK